MKSLLTFEGIINQFISNEFIQWGKLNTTSFRANEACKIKALSIYEILKFDNFIIRKTSSTFFERLRFAYT